MTKEQTFEHPPRGHVAMLYYDVANDRFQVVQGDDVDTAIPATAKALLASTLAHGYDGSAWRKQAPIWGYTDRILEQVDVVDAVDGQNNLFIGGVPEGEVWVVESMALINFDNVCTVVRFGAYDGSTWMWFDSVLTPPAAQYTFWAGSFRLKYQDSVGGVMMGCTVDDHIMLNISGYKMSIDM